MSCRVDSEGDTACREHVRALGVLVVVPVYNNAGTVGRVVASFKEYAPDILVVNDGSTDSTAQVLSGMDGVSLLSYRPNRGKGYALRLGLRYAARHGFRYVLSIDADGQHFAADIPSFVQAAEDSPDALLVGSRDFAADNMPARNGFANRFSNFWYFIETGCRLEDTQSGYRLYPVHKMEGMRLATTRYEFEAEVIVRARWRGIEVRNIPIGVYYAPPSERVTHFRPSRDFFRISLLNAVLVLGAVFYYYPVRFFRSLNRKNIRRFFRDNVLCARESNARLAAAMGWGVFCGIIPVWGYQMILAAVSAHFFRLNKVVALIFSNISIPPMIPLILYGSFVAGGLVVGNPVSLRMGEITFEVVGRGLAQYVVGSVLLAAACGAATFAAAWLIMTLFKRKRNHG